MADHFNIPIEDVISLRVKVNAAFEDLIIDTYKEKIEGLKILHDLGVYDDEEVLKQLGNDRMLERLRQMQDIEEEMKQEAIDEFKQQQQAQGLPPPPQQNVTPTEQDMQNMMQGQQQGQQNRRPPIA